MACKGSSVSNDKVWAKWFLLIKPMQSVVMNAGWWLNPLFADWVEDFDKNKKSTRHVANRNQLYGNIPWLVPIDSCFDGNKLRGPYTDSRVEVALGWVKHWWLISVLPSFVLGLVPRSSSAKNSTPKRQDLDAPMYVLCGLSVLFDAWC